MERAQLISGDYCYDSDMLTILLHSSKTMRSRSSQTDDYQQPLLLNQAVALADYLKSLSPDQISRSMQLSSVLASKTEELIQNWSTAPESTLPAIDAFLGDIYSGLQVQLFSDGDRDYANHHLFILSGLYGILRALDSIAPYRLEMGYRLPDEPYKNLHAFWGSAIADQLPVHDDIVNLSAVEYTKAISLYPPDVRVITPKFLTIDPKTGEPKFVVVHAKIARGAFARWLIQERIETVEAIVQFADLGYAHHPALSTLHEPVFVCRKFGGIGLSVRLIDS